MKMKSIEEQVKEIKYCAECDILLMKNHKRTYFKDDGSFDDVINAMHNALSRDALSKAYYDYINVCICQGYSDGEIIGGIMQNEEQNKKFNVDIETVIVSFVNIKDGSTDLVTLGGNQLITESLGEAASVHEEQDETKNVCIQKNELDNGCSCNENMAGCKSNLKINERCIQCGSCLGCEYDFLSSAEDGSIWVNRGTELSENSPEFKMLKDICPVGAFEIVKTKSLTKQDYVTGLDKIKNHIIKCPTKEVLKFDKKEYNIPIPVASGERRYEYSSDSAAERAAEREFDNKMYSQIDTLILKIISEYRVKNLKPYYTKLEGEGSFFAQCNAKLEEFLEDMVGLLKDKGLADDLPKKFTNVDVFPDSDIIWKMLNKGEVMSDEMISVVRKEFNGLYRSYLSSYNYWETDSMSSYAGTDRKGNVQFGEKYCYKNMHKAFEKLAEDILDSCELASNEIECRAMEIISGLIDVYNDLLHKAMTERVIYLENKLKLFPEETMKEQSLDVHENIVREIFNNSENEISINNCISKTEVFITECAKGQFFYDGSVIKRRFASDGVVRTEIILCEENFEYSIIYGFNGHILFVESKHCLWSYDCENGKLFKIASEVYREGRYQDNVFYVVANNIGNWRNTSCQVGCCKIDGSENRILTYTYNGLVSIQDVTSDIVYYKPILSDNISSIKWN